MGAISYYLGYSDKAKEEQLKEVESKLQVIVEEISQSPADNSGLDGKQKPLSRRQQRRLKKSLVAQ